MFWRIDRSGRWATDLWGAFIRSDDGKEQLDALPQSCGDETADRWASDQRRRILQSSSCIQRLELGFWICDRDDKHRRRDGAVGALARFDPTRRRPTNMWVASSMTRAAKEQLDVIPHSCGDVTADRWAADQGSRILRLSITSIGWSWAFGCAIVTTSTDEAAARLVRMVVATWAGVTPQICGRPLPGRTARKSR